MEKEQCLIDSFNEYGNFNTIEDVKDVLGDNKDYVLQCILTAMDLYKSN